MGKKEMRAIALVVIVLLAIWAVVHFELAQVLA